MLALGPSVSGALPLEELAKHGSQPLLRMAVAWIPAGFAAGYALALATRLRGVLIAASVGVLSLVILFLTTAASEALAHNEKFADHIGSALHRSGLWTAVVLAVIGSILAVAAARTGRRDRSAGSSGGRASGFWAV